MWKVIGHLDAQPGKGAAFGPHPRKVWVGKHVVKGYRRRKATGPSPRPASINMQAETYARWLAARDNTQLPAGARVSINMTTITSLHRTMTRNGREVPKVEQRVMSVTFHAVKHDRYRAVDTGHSVTVELPNWDFDPREPVEEIVCDEAAHDDDSWLFADVA